MILKGIDLFVNAIFLLDPSNILEYFMPKEQILCKGLMNYLLQNYLDKHDALNKTAKLLIKDRVGLAAENFHRKL